MELTIDEDFEKSFRMKENVNWEKFSIMIFFKRGNSMCLVTERTLYGHKEETKKQTQWKLIKKLNIDAYLTVFCTVSIRD